MKCEYLYIMQFMGSRNTNRLNYKHGWKRNKISYNCVERNEFITEDRRNFDSSKNTRVRKIKSHGLQPS